jgi:methylthioribose-1-phosphate isomerase
MIPTISWKNGNVKLIDQTKLPGKFVFITCRDVETLWHAIKRLSVRGAPALGVAAAFGILLGLKKFKGNNSKDFLRHIEKVAQYIGTSRPTAVNLFNALEQMLDVAREHSTSSVVEMKKRLTKEATRILEEDRRTCRLIGNYGEKLIKSGTNILTICNAGALATVDYGTALGVFYSAKAAKKKFHVYSCETRPLLQGARLTVWELLQEKIPTTLICDNMAATLMKQGKIQAVIAGADRIAANGDTANKIGTYSLAVLAKYHQIPFYIAAPFSTFDLHTPSGEKIPIEERPRYEVTHFSGQPTTVDAVDVCNPAFDVTDHQLISGIITEKGIIYPPYKINIRKIVTS